MEDRIFTQEEEDETTELSVKEAVPYLQEKLADPSITARLLYEATEKKVIAYFKGKGNRLYFTRRALNDFIAMLQKNNQHYEEKAEEKDQQGSMMSLQETPSQTLPAETSVVAIDGEPEVTCYRCGRVLLSPEDYTIIRFLEESPEGKRIVWHPVCADKRCDPTYLQAQAIQERERQKEKALEANGHIIDALRVLKVSITNRIEALIETYDVTRPHEHQ